MIDISLHRFGNKDFKSINKCLTLGVVVDRIFTNNRKDYDNYEAQFESLFNFDLMSQCFRKIGMTCQYPSPKNPNDHLFYDRTLRIWCDFGVDAGMRFSREKFIEAYLELDDKINPLITIIFFIAKCRIYSKSHFFLIKPY